MSPLRTILILAAAFLAVFWQSAFHGLRQILGAQIDLLPGLMVYAGLFTGLGTVSALSILGGLWSDALSANPLGISILPLFLVGFVLFLCNEVVLKHSTFAQVLLGAGAGSLVPLLTLLFLLTLGHAPLVGWITLWQLVIMAAGGAVATPVIFAIFSWLEGNLLHTHPPESSFRADREIRRGR